MKESLFAKVKELLQKKKRDQEIIITIAKECSMSLTEHDFTVSGNTITFTISSTKKHIAITKGLFSHLKEKGFICK